MTVVDASAWVSASVEEDSFHVESERWIEDQLRTGALLAGPTLVLVEVAGAVTRRTGNAQLGLRALGRLSGIPGLRLLDLDHAAGERAARLAVQLRLRGADAVYVEVARMLGEPLLSWDRELRERAGRVVEVLAL